MVAVVGYGDVVCYRARLRARSNIYVCNVCMCVFVCMFVCPRVHVCFKTTVKKLTLAKRFIQLALGFISC